jgi:hypothetical protein
MNAPRATAAALLLIGLAVIHADSPAPQPPHSPRWQLIPGAYTVETVGQPSEVRPTVWKLDTTTGRAWVYRYRVDYSAGTIQHGWMEVENLDTYTHTNQPTAPKTAPR